MAQHILRKDLKKDEIREKFVHGVESVASHQQMLWIVVTAALVVALGVFGWSSYTRRQTAKASGALDDAMKIFQARIRAPGEPSEPTEVTYVDEKNKYSDSERKFLEVANQYGRTRPGQVARYYAALSEAQLKKFADAEKNLQLLDSSSDENLTGLARFQLARVYDQDGKGHGKRQGHEPDGNPVRPLARRWPDAMPAPGITGRRGGASTRLPAWTPSRYLRWGAPTAPWRTTTRGSSHPTC